MMMTPEMVAKLKKSLVLHEGISRYPYTDSVGKITIGIGYNLSDRGLSDDWINKQFNDDVQYFYDQLGDYLWFQKLNVDRQIVIIDMAFMGLKKLLSFKKMIMALEKSDYATASFEMLNSKWAQQVKGRAASLAQGMLTGSYEI